MVHQYLLADFITRLNVGMQAHLRFTFVPYSDLNFRLLKLFYDNGLIDRFHPYRGEIKIYLRYNPARRAFCSFQLVSKPSKRVY
jgi:ribosomal protein S8